MYRFFFVFFIIIGWGGTAMAAPPRQIISLNQDWQFHFGNDVRAQPEKISVTLPHTWNATDVLQEKINYRRGTGIYEKHLFVNADWAGKRLFLYFEGVNSVATVLVNNHFVTTHKGGYTAFCAEITNFVKPGSSNKLEVQVSNAERPDVLPLCGDFNIYGGIHRPVSLLITSKDCITPLDYASRGVYLTPENVSARAASIHVLTKLSIIDNTGLKVRSDLYDANHHLVTSVTTPIAGKDSCLQEINLKHPHLWNGKADPYLYSVSVKLLKGDEVIDEVTQPLGLRYYRVDVNKGFMLNGKYLDLHGVGFHEDVKGKGSALDTADYDRDMQLINDLGATSIRLTHYPHGKYFYDLCDKNGLIVWSEIPLVGPGGYSGAGYIKSKELEDQIKQVLTELIRQNYNHPSICFWGLFNELKLNYDDPIPFLHQLNELAKKEDPHRLTTCASFLDNDKFNSVSDLIAWNKYYGWYGGRVEEMGTWADNTHRNFPNKPFAISEYGAGGSPFQHMEKITKPVADGPFHPEEWQTLFHEKNWEELSKRPFIWVKYVWCLKDFASSVRTEGDQNGINDKGLVTYDGKIKKDAFYFYRANWNTAPTLYLAEKRNNNRRSLTTEVKAYTNAPKVTLLVNGTSVGRAVPDKMHIVRWHMVSLKTGNNNITIKALMNGRQLEDQCTWNVATTASANTMTP